MDRGEIAPEDVMVSAGVARSTAFAAKARAAAGKGTPGKTKAPPGAGNRAPTRPQAKAATPLAKNRRAAVLTALAQALDGDPGLLSSLPLDASELGRRLADPGLLAEGDLDPLAILRRVQGRLERDMATLPPQAVVARKGVAAALVQLARGAEAIMADRPPVGDTPEQMAAKMIAGRKAEAIAKVFEHVEQEEGKAA